MSGVPGARVGQNEALFREINERIEAGRWADDADPAGFRCECAALWCNVLLAVPPREYERVRANARRFVLLPGHELPEVETVVERHPGYVVVEKTGVAGEVAERTDPRDEEPG